MWRRLSGGLTLRIFLITAALLAAACALTYGALAYLTPITYTALLEDELDAAAGELIARLEQTTQSESAPELARFTQQTGATAQLLLPDEFDAAVTEGTAGGAISEDDEIAVAEVAGGEAFASSDVAETGGADGDAPASGDSAAADADIEDREPRIATSPQGDIRDGGDIVATEDVRGDALASGDVEALKSVEGAAFASESLAASGSAEGNARTSADAAADAGIEAQEAQAAASSQDDTSGEDNSPIPEAAAGNGLASGDAAALKSAEGDARAIGDAASEGTIENSVSAKAGIAAVEATGCDAPAFSNAATSWSADGAAFASANLATSGSAEGNVHAIGDAEAVDADAEERESRAATSSQGDIPDGGNPAVTGAVRGGAPASGDVAASQVGEGDEFASAQIAAEADAAAGSTNGDVRASADAAADAGIEAWAAQAEASSRDDIPDEDNPPIPEAAVGGAPASGDVAASQVGEGDEFASAQIAAEADAAAGSTNGDVRASADAAADAGIEAWAAQAEASSRDDIPDEDNPPIPEAAVGETFASGDFAVSQVGEGYEFASAQIAAEADAEAGAGPEEQKADAEADAETGAGPKGQMADAGTEGQMADAEADAAAGAAPEGQKADAEADAAAGADPEGQKADAADDAEAGAGPEGQEAGADIERRGTWVAVSSEDDIGQSIRMEDGVAEISQITYMQQEADEAEFAGDVAVARELCYEFAFRDGQRAELVVGSGLRAVNRTTEAMRRVLPYLALALLAFSLVGALVYARFITRPIVDISALAGRIANLDFKARWRGRRRDEIGALGESLNRLSDSLSGALGELRTANDKLRADIERERELERARLAFFSATSHELKTPVTILKGQLSGMLAQVGAYRDREKYLARALEVANRMEALVQQILTVSRLESAAPMGDDAVNLSALLRRQLEQDAELIEARELKLAAEIAPDVTLRGSEKLLSSAIDNVLMNAILYSPPGAQIRVNLTPNSLRVFNGGARIDEADLPRLFEPFYRAEQSRSRATGGSGLGLYLVRRILELHGVGCAIENTSEGVLFEAKLAED